MTKEESLVLKIHELEDELQWLSDRHELIWNLFPKKYYKITYTINGAYSDDTFTRCEFSIHPRLVVEEWSTQEGFKLVSIEETAA